MLQGTSVSTALKSDHDLAELPSQVGTLLVGETPALPPSWATFLSGVAPNIREKLHTQSSSAVLFIEDATSRRLFAICFGQGHHALDSERIERQFGLRVVLNSVARNRLRTLDSASLDSTIMQRRTQASRESDLNIFGIDTNRDLLRLASGVPASSDFAKAMSGKDALHVRANLSSTELPQFCAKAFKIFKEKTYKTDFGFIDHVTPVESGQVISALDSLIFVELTKLVNDQASDLHLAIPDILNPEGNFEIGYFGLGLTPGAKKTYIELTIEDYVIELKKGDFSQIGDMSALRSSHEVRIIADGEGVKGHKRKLYSCFVFEAVLKGQTYVLFDSQWYAIDGDYVKEIDLAYNKILKPAFLRNTKAKNERDLILQLCGDRSMLCIDQTKSAPKGAPNAAIEACDFFSTQKQLIHLKDGHSSAPLSHLWNQALVATEALIRDDAFRRAFHKAIKDREKKYKRTGFAGLLPNGSQKLIPSDYKIIFGVMRHKYAKSGTLGLPFFSKVALRAAADRLSLMGFTVELHLIEKV
jgi:uncharacterized protein (TIGR04141 family)